MYFAWVPLVSAVGMVQVKLLVQMELLSALLDVVAKLRMVSIVQVFMSLFANLL